MKDPKGMVVGGTIGLVGLLFVGIFILIALGRETEQITTFALIVIPLVIGLGGVGALQADQAKKIDTVAKNVNGNSTKLIDENSALREALTKALNNEDHRRTIVAPPLMSEDTLGAIQSDVDRLPKH